MEIYYLCQLDLILRLLLKDESELRWHKYKWKVWQWGFYIHIFDKIILF